MRQPSIYDADNAQLIRIYNQGGDIGILIGGLYLAPFAGIMFLWFVAVIRDQIGEREDRFFSTVFFGSGVLFVAVLFIAAALASAPSVGVRYLGVPPPSSEEIGLVRSIGYTLAFAFATRAAAVFMFATATIGLRSGAFPRWVAITGYLLGLVLLTAVTFFELAVLVLPALGRGGERAHPPPRAGAHQCRRGESARVVAVALDWPRCPPSAPPGTRDLLPADRAAFVRLSGPARTSPPATATSRSRRRCSSRRPSSSAASARSPTSSRRSCSGSRRGPRRARRWALRPEPTAGIVRAYVQHGMQTLPQPVKLTITGPMFRYDRPQAGRYRQFWQFDVEAIGDPGPAIDAEIIELGRRFYREAGLAGVEVHLNSIGDAACRPAYIAELVAYYRGACRRRCRRSSATGWSATRCACWTRRSRRWPRSTRPRPRSPTGCATRARAHFASRPGAPRRARRRRVGSSRARARPRLLHAHGVRVLPPGARASSGARRRRPLRRAGRAAGRRADARHRVRARARPGRCSRSDAGGRAPTGEPAPVAVVVGADPDDTRRVCASRRSCARRGSRARADLGAAQARPAARGRRQRGRPFRGDPRRRACATARCSCATCSPGRSARWPSRTWPASSRAPRPPPRKSTARMRFRRTR